MAKHISDILEEWLVSFVRRRATPPPPAGKTASVHQRDIGKDIHVYSNGQIIGDNGQDKETGAIEWTTVKKATQYGDRSPELNQYDMSELHKVGESAIIDDTARLKRVKRIWATGATNAEIAAHFRGERGYSLSTIEKITPAYSAALSAWRLANLANQPI